jgi:hypothetical protein
MIGDPFKKVTTGQAFVPNTASWNAFADTARAHLQKQSNTARPYRPALGDRATTALVQNTGSGVGRFGILSITAPIVSPDTNLDEFSNYLAFQCGTFDVTKPFVITLEPIAANTVGMAVVAGTVPCQVWMQAKNDQFADVNSLLSPGVLTSGACGSVQILWADRPSPANYPATVWAIVRFGPACSRTWAQVISVYNGVAVCNPYSYATNTADTSKTINLVVGQVDHSGAQRCAFAPNLSVGDIIEYEAATGGINAWELANCAGWIKGDVLLPQKDASGNALNPAGGQNGMSLIIAANGGANTNLITADWPRFH